MQDNDKNFERSIKADPYADFKNTIVDMLKNRDADRELKQVEEKNNSVVRDLDVEQLKIDLVTAQAEFNKIQAIRYAEHKITNELHSNQLEHLRSVLGELYDKGKNNE